MSHGLQVSDVASDLNDAHDLMKSQAEVGLEQDEILNAMFGDAIAKIRSITNISSKDKQMLTNAISQGPWTHDQKKQLATCVRGDATSGVLHAGKRRNQRCLHLENYLTDKT